jgi:hypothetical protein
MAHPPATKAIPSARVKNDAVDAKTLAHLLTTTTICSVDPPSFTVESWFYRLDCFIFCAWIQLDHSPPPGTYIYPSSMRAIVAYMCGNGDYHTWDIDTHSTATDINGTVYEAWTSQQNGVACG